MQFVFELSEAALFCRYCKEVFVKEVYYSCKLHIGLDVKVVFHSSAAGSIPQTSHWQVSTEPAFVTKQKPSLSSSSPFSSTSSFSSSSFPSSLSSSLASSKPMTAITVSETVRIPSSGTNSHFWSNSWTPPRPSLKPHWTDSPGLLQNGPESFPSRPSFKPTESQVRPHFLPLIDIDYRSTFYIASVFVQVILLKF